MTCRTCRHLAVLPNKAGAIVPRSSNVYRCTVEVPPPILPACLTPRGTTDPYRRWMQPDDGEDCAFYLNRGKPTAATAASVPQQPAAPASPDAPQG